MTKNLYLHTKSIRSTVYNKNKVMVTAHYFCLPQMNQLQLIYFEHVKYNKAKPYKNMSTNEMTSSIMKRHN